MRAAAPCWRSTDRSTGRWTPRRISGAIRRLLASSERLTVREYRGLNHLFQPCTTGDVSEYETIGVTVAPEVLEELAAWIAAAGAEGARTGGCPFRRPVKT